MQPTISDAGPFEKLITFEIDEAELDQAKAKAARKLGKSLKIPGFRPGKAPRRVVEATVGPERLRAEAIDEALPDLVMAALAEADLEPAATPAVESLSDTEGGIEVAVRVATWPQLGEVPDYVGREIEVPDIDVGDEEVEEQLDRIRDQFAEIAPGDGAAGEGDYVSIDLSATRNGEPVESLSAQGLMVEIGGNEFIPGLSDAVTGLSAGESATFTGPLPAGFVDTDAEGETGEENAADDAVEYTVTVAQVHTRTRPELTDEWIDENTEFETLEEFIEELRRRLAETKLGAAYNAFRTELLTTLTDEIDLEIPDALVNGEMEEVLHRFSHTLAEQGIEIADYLRISGQDEQAFVADLRDSALRNIRTDLLLDAVAEDAGIEVEDEEFEDVLRALAAQSEQTVDEVKASLTEGQEKKLRGDILRRKAHDALLKAAVPVDASGTPIDFETLASQLQTTEDEADEGSGTLEEEE